MRTLCFGFFKCRFGRISMEQECVKWNIRMSNNVRMCVVHKNVLNMWRLENMYINYTSPLDSNDTTKRTRVLRVRCHMVIQTYISTHTQKKNSRLYLHKHMMRLAAQHRYNPFARTGTPHKRAHCGRRGHRHYAGPGRPRQIARMQYIVHIKIIMMLMTQDMKRTASHTCSAHHCTRWYNVVGENSCGFCATC